MLAKNFYRPLTQLAAALLLALAFWYYMEAILAPHGHVIAQNQNITQGNLSDLYPRWLGARELLLHGRNPYSPEVTREIQQGFYGREIDPIKAADPKDEERFAYPVYIAFLLAPFVKLQFGFVQFWSIWVLTVVTALSVPLWLYAVGTRASAVSKTVWVLLTLGSFPVAQSIHYQQLTLLVGFLLASCLAALRRGWLPLAGVLLAISTVKPQLVLPLAIWLGIWTASKWRERKALAWSFTLTIVLLVGGSELLLPHWIPEFLKALSSYSNYAGQMTVLQALFGTILSELSSVGIVLFVAFTVLKSWKEDAASFRFQTATAAVLVATLLLLPKLMAYNFVLLLPALVLLFERRRALLKSRRGRFLFLFAATVMMWPFVTAVALSAINLVAPLGGAMWSVPLRTFLWMPVAVFLALIQLFITAKPDAKVPELPISQFAREEVAA